MLSGRGLCDELITRLEKSYRLWCVVVCDLETSRMGAPYIYDISTLRDNYIYFRHLVGYSARGIGLSEGFCSHRTKQDRDLCLE